jgi:hypothetical protein
LVDVCDISTTTLTRGGHPATFKSEKFRFEIYRKVDWPIFLKSRRPAALERNR